MSVESETMRKPMADVLVSVILPVYNEAQVLEKLHQSVAEAIESCGCRNEMIFVNDGSLDESGQILDGIAATDPNVRVLHLSRNFGHQAAIQAGLAHASGDAMVVMDSDLQDDPASIARFLEKWQEGWDVVYAVRIARKEKFWKRLLFLAFYRVFKIISHIPVPLDAGNFSLVDREVARNLVVLHDRDRYYAGLRSWVGYRQVGVEVERGARYDAYPRVSLHDLWRLAISAIFSFSPFPLAIFYLIALLSMLLFLSLACFTLYHKFLTHEAISGWASQLMTASFFGALNALGIGILGAYVLRIYDQVRARPIFLVKRKVNFSEE